MNFSQLSHVSSIGPMPISQSPLQRSLTTTRHRTGCPRTPQQIRHVWRHSWDWKSFELKIRLLTNMAIHGSRLNQISNTQCPDWIGLNGCSKQPNHLFHKEWISVGFWEINFRQFAHTLQVLIGKLIIRTQCQQWLNIIWTQCQYRICAAPVPQCLWKHTPTLYKSLRKSTGLVCNTSLFGWTKCWCAK